MLGACRHRVAQEACIQQDHESQGTPSLTNTLALTHARTHSLATLKRTHPLEC